MAVISTSSSTIRIRDRTSPDIFELLISGVAQRQVTALNCEGLVRGGGRSLEMSRPQGTVPDSTDFARLWQTCFYTAKNRRFCGHFHEKQIADYRNVARELKANLEISTEL